MNLNELSRGTHFNYCFACEEQIYFIGNNVFLTVRDPVEFKSVSL